MTVRGPARANRFDASIALVADDHAEINISVELDLNEFGWSHNTLGMIRPTVCRCRPHLSWPAELTASQRIQIARKLHIPRGSGFTLGRSNGSMTFSNTSRPIDRSDPACPLPAASLRRAYKSYQRGDVEVQALDGIDIDFLQGELTAVMGPSGSGKSTLLHCCAGLDRLSDGSAFIGEVDLGELDDRRLTVLRRDRVGFVFQAFNLLPSLSALENITLPIDLAGREVDQPFLGELVGALGLEARLGHRPSQLSGGQQQRVAVARALLGRPSIVFADEPTGNLDSRSGAEVLSFLRHAAKDRGQSIIMVTHDPKVASYADRAVFLRDGQVVADIASPTAGAVLEVLEGAAA